MNSPSQLSKYEINMKIKYDIMRKESKKKRKEYLRREEKYIDDKYRNKYNELRMKLKKQKYFLN